MNKGITIFEKRSELAISKLYLKRSYEGKTYSLPMYAYVPDALNLVIESHSDVMVSIGLTAKIPKGYFMELKTDSENKVLRQLFIGIENQKKWEKDVVCNDIRLNFRNHSDTAVTIRKETYLGEIEFWCTTDRFEDILAGPIELTRPQLPITLNDSLVTGSPLDKQYIAAVLVYRKLKEERDLVQTLYRKGANTRRAMYLAARVRKIAIIYETLIEKEK